MIHLLELAGRVAVDTVAYLFAYWLVPVWAFAATAALLLLGRRTRPELLAQEREGAGRFGAALLLGLLRPYGRSGLRASLRRLEGSGAMPVAGYLAVVHALTAYYLLLLGPLMGKDVLLSHLVGGALFIPAAAALARLSGATKQGGGAGVPPPPGRRPPDPDTSEEDSTGPSVGRLLTGELGRAVGFGTYGFALGSLVAALGLAHPSALPVGEAAHPAATQALHAVLGAALAPATFMWPVATLLVGTYLWKVGIAHAGLVAFFYAAAASPQRIHVYRSMWGTRRGLAWGGALLGGAVLAGLGTALLYGATGLGINYKLSPAQMWTW